MAKSEQRRDKLRRLIRKADVDAMLVTNFANVTYLTGFTGDDSFLLVTHDKDILLSDPRYTEQLEEECPGLELAIRNSGIKMGDKMKTPVDPDPEADRQKLAAAYADPSTCERVKLLPSSSLEFQKPTTEDVVGFIVSFVICFAVIGLAFWLTKLGV